MSPTLGLLAKSWRRAKRENSFPRARIPRPPSSIPSAFALGAPHISLTHDKLVLKSTRGHYIHTWEFLPGIRAAFTPGLLPGHVSGSFESRSWSPYCRAWCCTWATYSNPLLKLRSAPFFILLISGTIGVILRTNALLDASLAPDLDDPWHSSYPAYTAIHGWPPELFRLVFREGTTPPLLLCTRMGTWQCSHHLSVVKHMLWFLQTQGTLTYGLVWFYKLLLAYSWWWVSQTRYLIQFSSMVWVFLLPLTKVVLRRAVEEARRLPQGHCCERWYKWETEREKKKSKIPHEEPMLFSWWLRSHISI